MIKSEIQIGNIIKANNIEVGRSYLAEIINIVNNEITIKILEIYKNEKNDRTVGQIRPVSIASILYWTDCWTLIKRKCIKCKAK